MICPLCNCNTGGIKVARMFTVSEVAELLGIARMTVYRWEETGILPPRIILGPSMSGWREEDISKLIVIAESSIPRESNAWNLREKTCQAATKK